MRRPQIPLPATLVALILAGAEVHGFNVYRLGGADGNPWMAALSDQPGEYLILGPDGEVSGRSSVATPTAYATWADTMAEVSDGEGGRRLGPFFVPDTLNLAQDGVRDRISRGYWGNLATTVCRSAQTDRIRPMFDGDPNTATFFTANDSDDPEIRQGFFIQSSVVDLGVDFPINRIRFFPRLADTPGIGHILDEMAPPRLRTEELAEEGFAGNFVPWFEVAAASSDVNVPDHCVWATAKLRYFQYIARASNSKSDPRLTILRSDRENLEVVVDIRFPLQQFRWITFRPLNPVDNWEIAEFQVFGQGYIRRATYITAVLDFGEPMAWGKIRWKGEKDGEAKVLIRTRSGVDDEPNRYWKPSAIPGEVAEISREEYVRAGVTDRSTTLDENHWSFWSAPYAWEAALADPTLPASSWQDGTPILSPGPTRYLQVQLVFLSAWTEAVKLEELEIQFSRPSATRVVGEIWPLDASRTESTRFTYTVRPTFDEANEGFNRLEIFTLTRVDTVHSVRVDGVQLIDEFPPHIQEDRILVSLPELRGAEDTFKLIEVVFEAHVVRYGTQFQGWVFNSQIQGVKQLIEPGDATVAYPGNTLDVRTEDLGAALLAEIAVFPNPFTPNGDGVNDEAHFQFQLHEVSAARDLQLSIYDISGRMVRQLDRQSAIRGLFGERPGDPVWDGLDEGGRKVAPGIYLYQISVEADTGKEAEMGTISVVY